MAPRVKRRARIALEASGYSRQRVITSPPAPVDLDRPLLAQVAAMHVGYLDWVYVALTPGRKVRIFESRVLEALTHARWWIVPVVWGPVVLGLVIGAVAAAGMAVPAALAWVAAGLCAWPLLEYLLHRFLFHMRPRTAVGRRVHFLLHGFHHLVPWDPTRVVFPPISGAILAAGIYLGVRALLPWGAAMSAMAGVLAGYGVYELTHAFVHHATPRSRWGRFVRRYHLTHHHRDWRRMFGVSQPLWDYAFRTGPRS